MISLSGRLLTEKSLQDRIIIIAILFASVNQNQPPLEIKNASERKNYNLNCTTINWILSFLSYYNPTDNHGESGFYVTRKGSIFSHESIHDQIKCFLPDF